MLICLDGNQEEPLGINVLPYCDDEEQCEGLIIIEIVKGGRIDRDGRFSIGDRIIEVNDQTLLNVNFETAHSIIGQALKENEMRLNIVKNSRKKPIYKYNVLSKNIDNNAKNIESNYLKDSSKPNIPNTILDENLKPIILSQIKENSNLIKLNAQVSNLNENLSEKDKNVCNNDQNVDEDLSDAILKKNAYNACNTRKIGKKYHIRLVKGSNGLGFSITTRDNQIGQCPIYIKNILLMGAAIDDGNLKQGDRLLEVNGIEMTGKTHHEALTVLREIKTGQTVDLIVSRQENDVISTFSRSGSLCSKLPRQLPSDKVDSSQTDLSKSREVLSFNIPLNDTGSAGLGVSVKGKTSASSTTGLTSDLGIFVKSVFHGGAAFKDGRLMPNDQLISINGISLLGLSNAEAMETLRRVVVNNEGIQVTSNSINLVIARVFNSNKINELLIDSSQEEVYDSFYPKSSENFIHQRNVSSISTDSMKLNFFENVKEPQASYKKQTIASNNNNFDFDEIKLESYIDKDNLINTYNYDIKNDIENDLTENYLISTHIKNSTQNDTLLTKSDYVHNKNFSDYIHNSSRSDVLIENDDQENNDPNKYHNKYQSNTLEKVILDVNATSCIDKSKDQLMNLSNFTSQLSLNDDESNIGFHRDGFGRQSMSEKRHAQLDVKNTDTYKRNKERKQQVYEDNYKKDNENFNKNIYSTSLSSSNENLNQKNTFIKGLDYLESNHTTKQFNLVSSCCCTTNQTYSQSSNSCPYHTQNSPSTEMTIASQNSSTYTASKFSQNKPHVSCMKPINQMNHNLNNYYNHENDHTQMYGQTGIKKSKSLESLMQDIKKNNSDYNYNLPYNTMRKLPSNVIRNRVPNESFRSAVDKSYEEYMDNVTMETVTEEYSECSSSIVPISNKVLSNKEINLNNNKPSSTSIGTTLSNGINEISDEEVGLIRRRSTGSTKKKSGLFRTLFSFGSKKFKDKEKQAKINNINNPQIKKELEEEVEKIRARKAALYEQEIIQEYYKRLIDQQKFQQIVQQKQQQNLTKGYYDNNLKPSNLMVSNSVQTNNHIQVNQDLDQNTYSVNTLKTQKSIYDDNLQSKLVIKSPYESSNLVYNQNNFYGYHETNKFNKNANLPNSSYSNSMQTCPQNYDLKEAMQRPGSRVGIVDPDNKFSHYMNYKEIKNQIDTFNNQPNFNSSIFQKKSQPVYNPIRFNSHQTRFIQDQSNIHPFIHSYQPYNSSNVIRRSSLYQKKNEQFMKKRSRPLSDFEIDC